MSAMDMDVDTDHGVGKTQQQRVTDRDYDLRFLIDPLGASGDRSQVTANR
ncbi:MAG: hypothetical protein M3R40_07980 [Pseudomonadota bacterium]|nr:hypothetical protein [Pseudomonadota bacterium]